MAPHGPALPAPGTPAGPPRAAPHHRRVCPGGDHPRRRRRPAVCRLLDLRRLPVSSAAQPRPEGVGRRPRRQPRGVRGHPLPPPGLPRRHHRCWTPGGDCAGHEKGVGHAWRGRGCVGQGRAWGHGEEGVGWVRPRCVARGRWRCAGRGRWRGYIRPRRVGLFAGVRPLYQDHMALCSRPRWFAPRFCQ